MDLLSTTITALESASIDSEHISYGFSALLRQLHLHTQLELAPSASDVATADALMRTLGPQPQPQSWEQQQHQQEEYSPFQILTIDGGLKFPWDAWDGFEEFGAQAVPPLGFDS